MRGLLLTLVQVGFRSVFPYKPRVPTIQSPGHRSP